LFLDLAGDGWLKVRHGNNVGMIPANYVRQTTATAPASTTAPATTTAPPPINEPEEEPVATAAAADYVVALYDFQAVNADELNLQEGDTILVTKRDDSGWWEGK
jgi:hypothetical protein